MAANNFASGSSDGTAEFDRYVDYVTIHADTGSMMSISLDGTNFIGIPEGLHSFRIGGVKVIHVRAQGEWQINAIQA